jgi:hypothetical protein
MKSSCMRELIIVLTPRFLTQKWQRVGLTESWSVIKILSRVLVTIDGVLFGE